MIGKFKCKKCGAINLQVYWSISDCIIFMTVLSWLIVITYLAITRL